MDRQKAIAKMKKKLEKMFAKRLKQREANKKTFTPPRYDDVFFEGLAYLDSIDSPPEFDKVVNEKFWELI
ncbi:MAG: hypothetical protein A2Y66_01730 [Nitrospirae bacterium RBG_13_41_22]|nr:MAG: hypothetical protein A2Y66_01730 [Nitrospirae bacterium RBG_13_41_22]